MNDGIMPFGQLSRDEKHNIVTAWLGGNGVEVFRPLDEKWVRLGRTANWHDHLVYRKAAGCA